MNPAALVFSLLLLPPQNPDSVLLDQGFNDLYNLSFSRAHHDFETWQKQHPESPIGPVFDAAAYLFSEFDRLKILQSQFFVDDKAYDHRKRETPDPQIKRDFQQALAQSKDLAAKQLVKSPNDENALFANVLRLGLDANYLALIEKQNLSALKEVKQGTEQAEDLLKLHPDCYDAYIAIGIENYLLSLKPAPVRWLLNVTGAQTDRQTGIEKLKLTAAKGHYLQPYAELLLAVAALRDKNTNEARRRLSDLAQRFPMNPLYRQELNRIP